MTETRSEYRKKQKKEKNKKIFNQVKSAFSDKSEELDVNPDFQKSKNEADRHVFEENNAPSSIVQDEPTKKLTTEEKALRLKKRLNRAIILVLALIIIVLLALFHL